ncbi:hypothetical protein Hanom_Chr07g00674081 [Helianthus anomalus]
MCWFVVRFGAEGLFWIEARSVYIPPFPDPMSSFAICGIYWVWLLLLYLI